MFVVDQTTNHHASTIAPATSAIEISRANWRTTEKLVSSITYVPIPKRVLGRNLVVDNIVGLMRALEMDDNAR